MQAARPCGFCGDPVRKWAHRKSSVHVFCCRDHYMAHRLTGHVYVGNRCAQRRARTVVARYYGSLPAGSVVHHHDRDTTNNETRNLALFANHADHMAYHHRLRAVLPMWDGRNATAGTVAA